MTKLEAYSIDTLHTHSELCYFFTEWMSTEEQMRHEIPKALEELTIEDELSLNANKPEWAETHRAIAEVWDRKGGRAAVS